MVFDDPKIEIPWPWLAGVLATAGALCVAGAKYWIKWFRESQKSLIDILTGELERSHRAAEKLSADFLDALARRDEKLGEMVTEVSRLDRRLGNLDSDARRARRPGDKER